jgi:hypothetical protein
MDGAEIDGRVPREMTPTGEIDGGATSGRADAHNVKEELLRLDEWLKALVDTFEERPSAIDGGVLRSTTRTVDVEAAITEVYRTLKSGVFTAESPLRGDNDLWEAFREQREEFIEFYKRALNAVETHKEVLLYFTLVKDEARSRSRHGDLGAMLQDKQAYLEERDACITAFSNFYGKFSAMLADLRS